MTEVTTAIEEAIALLGSEAKLGEAAGGFSQNAIWQAKTKGRISPELALGIHRATVGKIPASRTRPDLWPTPEHVPLAPADVPSEPERAT
jgi:DNA-binding transcriptional regulator YdaS (Cro superfamily)